MTALKIHKNYASEAPLRLFIEHFAGDKNWGLFGQNRVYLNNLQGLGKCLMAIGVVKQLGIGSNWLKIARLVGFWVLKIFPSIGCFKVGFSQGNQPKTV